MCIRDRETLEQARRGQAVFVESYGAEQVAIVDALDYHLLRAVATYRSQPPAPISNPEMAPRGLADAAVRERVAAAAGDVQEAWDVIMASYLDGDISLGRAGALLNMQRFDLQGRFNRLGLPARLGPLNIHETRAEYEVLLQGDDQA